ncbi:hypothetical protein SAMN05421854_104549 [Amycolatopsis rubida]|uniref:Uncharacterized protein n=1 Tax=Amycolatopsis rubida TaxID=112413 RepID=A0A1I5NW15_9PSEU|nr:hypothetical protein SAMN05421854_104549 [Amycolatopsis rubida]
MRGTLRESEFLRVPLTDGGAVLAAFDEVAYYFWAWVGVA